MAEEFKIPEEYSKADFGFSAIDEATYKAQQKDNEETPPSLDENDIKRAMLELLKPLEDKLDTLQSKKRAEDDDNVQLAIAQSREAASGKLKQLEEIIMPLLVNLSKTSDKEYIYWPDREKVIKEQMQKVLSITRG
tara:strand:- start:6 stop:413 length:408 start_codon:yes stop_codon:yes gene_type:complete